MASSTAIAVAMRASCRLSAKRSLIASLIGAPVHMDVPKSRRASPPIHEANCCQTGRSRPSRLRSTSSVSLEANELSPAKRSSTMSPGTMRIRKKMSTATPRSVGIIRSTRFRMYEDMSLRLFGEPDRVQLLVEVVARRDRPALHLRAVGNDAVPLQGVEVVDLVVEQPALELAQVLLALLPIAGPALLLVELVENLVGVPAVVRRALVLRLELVEIEVGLHDVAAREVHGHVEV